MNLHTDGERIVQIARRGGREQVGCIVLGHLREWVDVFEAGRPSHPAGTA